MYLNEFQYLNGTWRIGQRDNKEWHPQGKRGRSLETQMSDWHFDIDYVSSGHSGHSWNVDIIGIWAATL